MSELSDPILKISESSLNDLLDTREKLIAELRANLAPAPCGKPGHTMSAWVHFTDCAHPTYTDTQIGPGFITRTCNTCAARIDDMHVTGRMTNPMHPGTPGYGKHDYCQLCAAEAAAVEAFREKAAGLAKKKCGMAGSCETDARDPEKCVMCDLAEEIRSLASVEPPAFPAWPDEQPAHGSSKALAFMYDVLRGEVR